MARGMFLYDFLNRFPFARSFRRKVFISVLACVLLPVAALELYLTIFLPLRGPALEQAIWVSSAAAVLASLLAYWALSTILGPILQTSHQLNSYLSDRKLPELPSEYKDEVGNLMSNINYVTRSLNDLLESSNQNGAIDHLTGIYNRRSSENRLRDAIELSRIRQTTLSFAILDLDNFKHLNDTYGHDFGDSVLRQIGDCLRGNVRRTDWVGRWGGDEFVIAVQGGEAEASAMLSRIGELIRRELFIAPDRSIHHVTISCGVCEWSELMDSHELFTNADEALYAAKRHGRDQVQLFSELAPV